MPIRARIVFLTSIFVAGGRTVLEKGSKCPSVPPARSLAAHTGSFFPVSSRVQITRWFEFSGLLCALVQGGHCTTLKNTCHTKTSVNLVCRWQSQISKEKCYLAERPAWESLCEAPLPLPSAAAGPQHDFRDSASIGLPIFRLL